LAVSVLPAVNYGVTRLEELLYRVGSLQPGIDWFETHVRGVVVPTAQQVFAGGLLVALVLVGIVALNALADRFWCRALCPLGALLGLLARVSVLRPVVGAHCTSCAACATACGWAPSRRRGRRRAGAARPPPRRPRPPSPPRSARCASTASSPAPSR